MLSSIFYTKQPLSNKWGILGMVCASALTAACGLNNESQTSSVYTPQNQFYSIQNEDLVVWDCSEEAKEEPNIDLCKETHTIPLSVIKGLRNKWHQVQLNNYPTIVEEAQQKANKAALNANRTYVGMVAEIKKLREKDADLLPKYDQAIENYNTSMQQANTLKESMIEEQAQVEEIKKLLEDETLSSLERETLEKSLKRLESEIDTALTEANRLEDIASSAWKVAIELKEERDQIRRNIILLQKNLDSIESELLPAFSHKVQALKANKASLEQQISRPWPSEALQNILRLRLPVLQEDLALQLWEEYMQVREDIRPILEKKDAVYLNPKGVAKVFRQEYGSNAIYTLLLDRNAGPVFCEMFGLKDSGIAHYVDSRIEGSYLKLTSEGNLNLTNDTFGASEYRYGCKK